MCVIILTASVHPNDPIQLILYIDISQSYILKLNVLFVCLFVCSELIEELVRATHLKFGMCM